MKWDPPKTKYYQKQLGKKSNLKQQYGIILSFINPLHMTTPWICYCNAQNTRACPNQENELFLKAAMRSSLSSWHILGMAGEHVGETGEQLGEKKCCVHFIRCQQAWRLLRCFSTRVGSYPGPPSMCSSQTKQLGRHSSSRRRCWPRMLKTQLHLKRSSSTASSWHPSAFSFCSSPSKPQDNSFFRSTRLVKVWKCLMGMCFNFSPPLQA